MTARSTPSETGPGSSVSGREPSNTSNAPARSSTSGTSRSTTGLEDVTIRFEAAANSRPNRDDHPGVGRRHAIQLTVADSSTSGMFRYVAASPVKLMRDSRYNYGISAGATASARRTAPAEPSRRFSQQLRVYISEIDIISDSDDDWNGELIFDFDPCPGLPVRFDYRGPASKGGLDGRGTQRSPSTSRASRARHPTSSGRRCERRTTTISPRPSVHHRSLVPLPSAVAGQDSDWEWNSPCSTSTSRSIRAQRRAIRSFAAPSRCAGSKLSFAIRG